MPNKQPGAPKPNGKTGTNGGRKGVDWVAARAFYLSLPPHERTFIAVARRFSVSNSLVRRIAHRDGWPDEAARMDARVAAAANGQVERTAEQRRAQILRMFDTVGDKLEADVTAENGSGELELAQLLTAYPQLHRMVKLEVGEATDRVAVADVQGVVAAVFQVAARFVPRELRGPFMAELEVAAGGLVVIEGGKP